MLQNFIDFRLLYSNVHKKCSYSMLRHRTGTITCNNSIAPVFILIQNPCTVIYDNFIIWMVFHEI